MLNRLTDVFKSFQNHNLRYVVIGEIAAILYGVPRATFDLDILIEATPENAQNLLDSLTDARFGTADLTTSQEILANEITVFQDRVRIDVTNLHTRTGVCDGMAASPGDAISKAEILCGFQSRFDRGQTCRRATC